MNNLLIILPFIFSLYTFFSIGSLANNKVNILKKNDFIGLLILGFAIFVIISFHCYFVFKINIFFFIIILMLVLFIYHIKFFHLIKLNLKKIRKYFTISLLIFIIFYIPILISGEQFYVFRGNNWDSFNYLSSALLFNKHSYNELLSDQIIDKYLYFQSIKSIINYRPYANYFLSIYLNFKTFDIFFINYSFKVFISIINFLAFLSFLEIFKKINKNTKIFISFVFTFSFFYLYVFEIDALSHLLSISIFLVCTKQICLLLENKEKKLLNVALYLSTIISALFIIYPELFLFFLIILSSFVFATFLFKKKKIDLKFLSLLGLFFLILTLSSYQTNYKFLISQIYQSLNSEIDWWGYYGAFIFGKENLVLNQDYLTLIQEQIKNKNFLNLVSIFYLDHVKYGYNFIFLNIIPSICGMYYLSVGTLNNFYSYLNLIFILFLNFYLLYKLSRNIKFIKRNKNILTSILITITIVIFLTLNGNFWTVIKLYSYSLIFIFIFLVIDLKKETVNLFILLLLIIFPFYKYSVLTYGIGKIDSFPSIIKKNLKKDIDWDLTKKDLANCDTIVSFHDDYFVKSYVIIKSMYFNKIYNNSNNLTKKNGHKYCEVSIIQKKFVVTSIDD